MGMRAPAGLHCRHLSRLSHVGDVEDSDSPEPLGAHRVLHALRATVESAARLLDRHKEQVAMDGNVALAAGTNDGREQSRTPAALDVVRIEAVIIAEE